MYKRRKKKSHRKDSSLYDRHHKVPSLKSATESLLIITNMKYNIGCKDIKGCKVRINDVQIQQSLSFVSEI